MKNFIFIFLTLILVSGCTQQQKTEEWIRDLSPISPEEVGISSERLNRVDVLVNQYIEDGKFPGAVVQISRRGKTVYSKSYGLSNAEDNLPMNVDNIFRIASQTKAITTVALMTLYERGEFLLDDPVHLYIPEFKDPTILVSLDRETGEMVTEPAKGQITIRHLLSHTSGIGYGFINPDLKYIYDKNGVIDGLSLSSETLDNVIPKLGQLPVLFEPGSGWEYGMNTDVAGYLVEVISGQTLSDYFEEHIFQPLGMEDTYFYLPDSKSSRLVPVYESTEDGFELPEGNDTNYPVEGSKTFYSGGGGLSSTAKDYSIFMEMLMNDGIFNGAQVLGKKTIELMVTNQIGDLRIWDGAPFGLGFRLTSSEQIHESPSSLGNYAWGGIFNTRYWLDPKEDLTVAIMLQMLPFAHPEFHQKMQVLVYQSLVE